MAISKVQAMRPALNDVIDVVNQMDDIEPYITATVDEWLDAHPEATTTVQDNSITSAKLVNGSITDAKLAQTGGVLEKVGSIFETVDIPVSVREVAGATAYMGYNGSAENNPSCIYIGNSVTGYDSYLFITSEPIDIWFNGITTIYLALSYGTDYTGSEDVSDGIIAKCSNPVRYRNSENNLPTEDNKLHVPANAAVCFTIRQGTEQAVYGLSTATVIKESFSDEILNRAKGKVLVSYNQTSDTVFAYVPARVGYVRYSLKHVDDSTINADIWHVEFAWSTSDYLGLLTQLTTPGEWEIAIRLTNRDDFSGGSAHGDQVLVGDPIFMMDGGIVSLSDLAEVQECDEFVVLQTSNMYDPADHETVIAIEACQHKWTRDGLEVQQSLKWQGTYTLATSYLAMFPPAKAATDYAYLDSDMTPKAASSVYGVHYNTQWACLYGASNGVRMEFWVEEYPDAANSGKLFLMADNGGNLYNKCYYVAAHSDSSTQVTANTLWKSTSRYRIEVGE